MTMSFLSVSLRNPFTQVKPEFENVALGRSFKERLRGTAKEGCDRKRNTGSALQARNVLFGRSIRIDGRGWDMEDDVGKMFQNVVASSPFRCSGSNWPFTFLIGEDEPPLSSNVQLPRSI
jgi:hypothetical protein